MNRPAHFPDMRRESEATSFAARFTTAEFLHMIAIGAFDDMKVELIDGELERMNPPQNAHSARQTRILVRLATVLSEGFVRVEAGIDLGFDTVVACDAAVLTVDVSEDRLLRPDEILLVVEVAESTAARDRGMKRLAYARAGIPHYWVVDAKLAVTHIYGDPAKGDYADIATIRFGEPLPVPGTDRTITVA